MDNNMTDEDDDNNEDTHARFVAQVMGPLRVELERVQVSVRQSEARADTFDVYSRYRKMQIAATFDDEEEVLTILLANDGSLNLMLDEEDSSRCWLHTESSLLPASLDHNRVRVIITAMLNSTTTTTMDAVLAVARAYFRHDFFDYELLHHLLPNACFAEIETTAPGVAHVTVSTRKRNNKLEKEVLEFDVGASKANGLAITHLTVPCDGHDVQMMMAKASLLLADYAQGWTFDTDSTIDIESLPMPTLRAALRAASLLAQLAAVAAQTD
jgi:hypothetical protein